MWLNGKTNFTQQVFIEGKITAGIVFKLTFIKHLPGAWHYYNRFVCVISLGSHNSVKQGPPPPLTGEETGVTVCPWSHCRDVLKVEFKSKHYDHRIYS